MLIEILKSYCPNAEVWAYGSRIKGEAHEGSDLDLVVKDFGTSDATLGGLRELFTESRIAFLIDVHEFDYLPKFMQEEILKDYVVIYNGKNNNFA